MANIAQLSLPLYRVANGEINLPGSKSISNRYLLLSALCGETTLIHNLLDSDDTDRMKEALIELGVSVIDQGNGTFEITGNSESFPVKKAELFLGNAGTAFRSLTAALALNDGNYALRGIPRMHERPIKDLVDALNQLGLSVEYESNIGYPPLKIKPSKVTNHIISVKGSVSSQYLTALLLSLPMIEEEVTINIDGELISKPYIDITLEVLKRFGIEIINDDYQSFIVPRETQYQSPKEIYVEGDASSASYFLAAGAIAGDITVHGIGTTTIQGDVQFANVLEEMGANVEWHSDSIRVTKPINGLKGIDIDCNHIPDAAMTLAIIALYAEGSTTLRNIASWRVKETDRISAMATELKKLGVKVMEGSDYITVTPTQNVLQNIAIDTYDDHRIAMCFSLCSFLAPIIINDPSCVNKTFPDYFDQFKWIVEI